MIGMDSTEMIGNVHERYKSLERKGYDWVSFYTGWLEGRFDLLRVVIKKSPAVDQIAAIISDEDLTSGEIDYLVALLNDKKHLCGEKK